MSDTFMKITNREVYDEIKKLRVENSEQHNSLVSRLDRTNGKVKLNRWISTTAISLAFISLGFLLNHL